MANIVICDDHPFTLMGTKAYVEKLGHHVVAVCANGIEALNIILTHRPDIALLDFNLPGYNGLEVLERLQEKKSNTKVILVTMHKEVSIYKKSKELGICGYVLKEYALDAMEECINTVQKGDKWFSQELLSQLDHEQSNVTGVLSQLTFVERKIVNLVAQQKKSKEIGMSLFISEKTVENHRSNIIKKLGLPNEKNALLVWALQNKENQ